MLLRRRWHIRAIPRAGSYFMRHLSTASQQPIESTTDATLEELRSLALTASTSKQEDAKKELMLCCEAVQPNQLTRIALKYASAQRFERESAVLLKSIAETARKHVASSALELSDLVLLAEAFARSGFGATSLLHEMASNFRSHSRLKSLSHEQLAKVAWSYAMAKHSAPKLFNAIAAGPHENGWTRDAQSLNCGLRTAWAFAAASHRSPDFFTRDIMRSVEGEASNIDHVHLSQLHQWLLWQQEQGVDEASAELRAQCLASFTAQLPRPSAFQQLVTRTISGFGIPDVREEVLTDQGYRIDAVLTWQGKVIGIEADGPSHFMGSTFRRQDPTAATLLKRRQLRTLGKWQLLSIPHYHWPSDRGGNQRRAGSSNRARGNRTVVGEDPDLQLTRRRREYLGRALAGVLNEKE